jgi:hypothetical protein
VVTRLLLAAQKVREIFWYQVVMNLLLAALILFFVGRFGALGYPAGLLAFYVFSLFPAGLLCSRYFPGLRYWAGLRYLAKVTALDAAALFLVAVTLRSLLPAAPLAGAALAAFVYFGVLAWLSVRLGVNEDFRQALAGLKGKIIGVMEG